MWSAGAVRGRPSRHEAAEGPVSGTPREDMIEGVGEPAGATTMSFEALDTVTLVG